MVAVVRALLPTDLLALLAQGRSGSYENRAWPRERLGGQERQPGLGVVRDQFMAFGRERSTWVSMRRHKVLALVGTRHRGGRQAREIDCLFDMDADAGAGVLSEVLTRAVKAVGEEGAEKLFLRLAADSDHLGAAHEAGFVPYRDEALYVSRGLLSAEPAECLPVTAADSYPLFRLYTAATPEPARRHEAATYAEWQAGMERRWLRNGVHLARQREGRIEAAVKASRLPQGDLFELTLAPDASVGVAALMAAAARQMAGHQTGPMLTLVTVSNQGVARQLEDAGFEVAVEYVSLVHRTTRPLTLPRALPAVAKNAVGV